MDGGVQLPVEWPCPRAFLDCVAYSEHPIHVKGLSLCVNRFIKITQAVAWANEGNSRELISQR